MLQDRREQLRGLRATMASVAAVTDPERLRRQVAELTTAASAPDLWDDPAAAQQLTSRLSGLTSELERLESLLRRLDDAEALLELAEEEPDEAARAEVSAEVDVEFTGLAKAVGDLEVRTLLSGPYDIRHALVQINPGAGGVDSQDWAEMLVRMYLRYCERSGYPYEVYETQEGEEAGIKSATFAVQARYAYGTMASEHGVHRLVRISPFDNQARRQTSFAKVDVTPVVEASDAVEIDEKDLRVDIYRSSGPGGQGVNTTDSAVRLTHLPTGIVVTCQNERSQLQNKATAMGILAARLLERRRQEEAAAMDALRGTRQDVAFGSQIRSYVLHPYQMVKDLRTQTETGNVQAVLDGEIDEFITAGIRWRHRAPEG